MITFPLTYAAETRMYERLLDEVALEATVPLDDSEGALDLAFRELEHIILVQKKLGIENATNH